MTEETPQTTPQTEPETKPKKKQHKKRVRGICPPQLIAHQFTSDQDREKASINGRKGAYARARQVQERKTMAETLAYLLSLPVEPGASSSVEMATNLKEAKAMNPPAGEMIALSQIARALKGDTKAAEYISEVLGEMAAKKVTVSPLEGLAAQLQHYEDGKIQDKEDTENEEEEE
jgi:hypothetical protein